jgi:hypothetical protein
MLWVVWLFLLALIGFATWLLVEKEDLHDLGNGPQHDAYYATALGLACASMAAVLVCLGAFVVRCWRTVQQHRHW